MKDNFSTQSDHYARYRPGYPDELFSYIAELTPGKEAAWDCGTGNGQVAGKLAAYFRQVYATDISQNQLDNAIPSPNISYSLQPAEKTSFPDKLFDLIIVAQAIHWFNFDDFYREVKRTLKQEGYLVVTGYHLLQIAEEMDALIRSFYEDVVGPYWDEERRYIDEKYQTIPFPFEEIRTPEFSLKLEWTLEHLLGYLNTWSAVKHFQKKNGYNPVDELKEGLRRAWGDQEYRTITLPLLLRIGRLR
ncbi:class I SAM-dependent methyltransferase [Chitinophaga tropicalis]|uniref:Methyltransferase domain-containing protein n=1 Tax=Chitinophaga tropicalis TaxID=2683588 RepID=A0A7K1U7F5_9BACT|nr:class I SAM-dependent methyltransferase [Chitinophaga tropicalis]MVT10279.1 methyltransferase domain-containing protein [Chitinophaga tropicalis]